MPDSSHDELAARGDTFFKEVAAELGALPDSPLKTRLLRRFAVMHETAAHFLHGAREGGLTTFSGGEPTT